MNPAPRITEWQRPPMSEARRNVVCGKLIGMDTPRRSIWQFFRSIK